MQNHSYENDFDLHENETACRTHFHMKGFELRLGLKQRHERTREWPIAPSVSAQIGESLLEAWSLEQSRLQRTGTSPEGNQNGGEKRE